MHASDLSGWCLRPLLDQAAALSFMREGIHDVRPALLLLFHAGDATQAKAVADHGFRYLAAYADARGLRASEEALWIAALDALLVCWRRRAPEPVSVRSRQLRMRNGTFYELRTAADNMYRARLHEARVRFASGTIYTGRSLFSKKGLGIPARAEGRPCTDLSLAA